MEFQEKLETILSVYNINATELAEKIGVQRSNVSHISSGRNKPSLDFMIKLKNEFPDLSWDWLLLDSGPMKESMKVKKEEKLEKIVNAQSQLIFDDENDVLPQPKAENRLNSKYESQSLTTQNKKVEKIVWFYSDGTFKEFSAV